MRAVPKTLSISPTSRPDEIQAYFENNSNVCGRFKKIQSDSISIQIPSHIFIYKHSFIKCFYLLYSLQWEPLYLVVPIKTGINKKSRKIQSCSRYYCKRRTYNSLAKYPLQNTILKTLFFLHHLPLKISGKIFKTKTNYLHRNKKRITILKM